MTPQTKYITYRGDDMNKVILIGNLSQEPILRTTTTGQSVGQLALAVPKKSNRDEADFITVVVWGKQAENCGKYLNKGAKVAVIGSMQTRNYEGKNGKVYVTEVVADEVEFLGGKKQESQSIADREFATVMDDSLPF